MENTNYDDFSSWDIETVIQFVKENILQFLLLLLVFVIVYAVDHITNINAMLYAAAPLSNAISLQKPATSKKKSKK
jgi:hypothetical protein